MYALYLPGDCPKLVPEPREKNRKKKVKQGGKTNARLAPPGDCPKLVSEQEKKKKRIKRRTRGEKNASHLRGDLPKLVPKLQEKIYILF